MGTLFAFILVSIALPILRNRHPELKGAFTVPGGPYIIPVLSAVTALGLIYYLKVGNPLFYGIPIVWFWFVVWMIIGLVFYAIYGRRKSTVALQQTEGLAAAQPPVN
jgi:APA family basic amino acid/polyamine antiporter